MLAPWILVALLTGGGCSEASDRLSAWPVLGSSASGQGSTAPRTGSTTVDEAQTGKSTPKKDTRARGETQSSDVVSSTEEEKDPSNADSEGTQTQGSGTSTGSESSEPNACVKELCIELNGEGTPDRSLWRKAHHTFPIKIPNVRRRLARIELMEGYARGTTSIKLRRAMSSRSKPLAEFSWELDLLDRFEWNGADLEEPLELTPNTMIWVELKPVPGAIASVAARGKEVSLWYRPLRSNRWTKSPAPVMFRAYCCKEP